MTEQLLRGPLHDLHASLDATFAPFGGWEMPIQYKTGVVAEHTAVREDVGIFDVSHLGKVRVTGPGAAGFVNRCLTNDLDRIAPGKAQYTLCCTESGGTVDDIIVYLVGPEDVFLVPNAANTAEVARMLIAAAPEGISVTDEHRDHAVLAVQGPRSAELLDGLGLPTELEYMAYRDARWRGINVRVCRTGYTGEHGYELIPAWGDAPVVWEALREAGATACGLGARDTLRTEMGYPLHGHELSLEISPVQAGSTWAVGWKKDEFWGRAALVAERKEPARRLRCLRALERGVPRPDMAVLDADGKQIGVTTSGTFSPTLKTGIALALIDTSAGVDFGTEVTLDVRGRKLRFEVVKPPFVQTNVR
ncbi:glycine cleavage system aminomethyltransferase GcvT [Kibdelosporangium phytohabitans]|uniref:aminomethyltransferase n=1 Tax=Kibdelosporangium phytohabitans TaxID=860235 RepID=A0A0N9HZI7_9PSEU|nr:glycine cleavage system aminomethyltransferase GcvT [Kibdelosporangium phytohabitans]ALG07768.1 glycine cleavage system protein T [Kibdelosporangium phytohabitans]MBE1471318.1 aminomethyltransferase [Kibdelosporangium phytohabitans]